MHRFSAVILLSVATSVFGQTAKPNLFFVDTFNSGLTPQFVQPLPDGNILVVGSAQELLIPTAAMRSGNFGFSWFDNSYFVAAGNLKLGIVNSTSGSITVQSPLDSAGNYFVRRVSVDAIGDVWIAGTTDADDLPLTNALVTQKAAYQLAGFVVKLDPTGTNVLFSSFLGSSVTGIALDSTGNAYLTGNGDLSNMPASQVFGAKALPVGVEYAFAVKLSATGQLVYSDLIGGDTLGHSLYTGEVVSQQPTSIAVDSQGAIIAGSTNAANFPATPNSYQPVYDPQTPESGFITRISADGKSLVWSTFISRGSTGSSLNSLSLDASGDVYVEGSGGPGIATAGAWQTAAPSGSDGSFLLKLTPDGSKAVAATYLPDPGLFSTFGLTLDSAGNPLISSHTGGGDLVGVISNFGLPAPAPGDPFLLTLDPALATPAGPFLLTLDPTLATQLSRSDFPIGAISANPAYDASRSLLLASSNGTVLRFDPSAATSVPSLYSLTNSATLLSDGSVAPGELATLFGTGLGPSAGAIGAPNANGQYPVALGGLQVLYSYQGSTPTPIPLLYAGFNQINLQIPFAVQTGGTLQVVTASGALAPVQIVANGSLGVFRASNGAAAALNQDATVNGPANPAKPGSIVSLFVTGLGNVLTGADGAVAQSAGPVTIPPPVTVFSDAGVGALPVSYVGPAPGLIDGVSQINVQVPNGKNLFSPGAWVLTVSEGNIAGSSGFGYLFGLPISANAALVYVSQ